MDSLIFNGIDITTGAYAQPELGLPKLPTGEYVHPEVALTKLAQIVRGALIDPQHELDLKRKEQEATPTLAPLPGVKIDDLAQTGWGVIFAHVADPAIKESLAPLLKLREQQATVRQPLFRVFEGVDGYRNGESKNDYLMRLPHSVGGGRGVAPGPCNPRRIPYYLLLVGDPQEIPYRFQYELDVDYAVGRLTFATTKEYADYAAAVVAAEIGPAGPRRAVFFGTRNRSDRPTMLSADHLVGPLAQLVAKEAVGWTVETVIGEKAAKAVTEADSTGTVRVVETVIDEQATKAGLLDVLGGKRTPSVLFTATHGAVLPSGDPQQERRQGALICQNWPGPVAWRKPLGEDFYVWHDDIPAAAKVQGLLAFFFACYSAGTPQSDNFGSAGPLQQIAPDDLVAELPRRLLAGGALAIVGHVDRAFSYSFEWGRAGYQLDVYQSILTQLLAGIPIGAAMEVMNQFYASIAVLLGNEREFRRRGKVTDDATWTGLWAANNDARNFVVLGDPAVRLKVDHAPRG